jgi:hypothetical protein
LPAMSPRAALCARSKYRPRRGTLCDWFSFSPPPGEQILGYPIAGENEAFGRGQRRFNIVWYRPAAEDGALQNLLTDTRGVQHELSIPPDVIRPEVAARMRADAESPGFGRYLRAQHMTDAERALAEQHRDPHAVMAETTGIVP